MRLLALSSLVLLVAACDASDDSLETEFTLRDEEGAVVSTGTLDFDAPVEADVEVTGTYSLRTSLGNRVEEAGTFHASCGVGPVRDELVVSFDTQASDSGVLLLGTCADGIGGGTWAYITVAGPIPAGTFEVR